MKCIKQDWLYPGLITYQLWTNPYTVSLMGGQTYNTVDNMVTQLSIFKKIGLNMLRALEISVCNYLIIWKYLYLICTSVDILLDSTRSTEILSWKKIIERVESSKIQKWHSLDSLEFSLICFEWVPSTHRVFWRSIVIFMHLQKMFCPTKWWYAKCSFDNK